MQGISAVIITRNEERNIGRCLSSLKEVVDEVIVVDAESTDATQRIARELGARVVERAWTDYSDQKNHANDLAMGPYILSMDADEALSPELSASLRAAQGKGLDGAYACDRLTNYCGTWVHHGGWYPDTKVRLFPKDGATWEGAHVHEVLRLADPRPPTRLKGDLLHYSYYTIADHKERIERYSSLHAQAMYEAGKRAGFIKVWLSPIVKFIQGFLLQLGALDGKAGWNIAWYSARAVHLKYLKLQALSRGTDRSGTYHP